MGSTPNLELKNYETDENKNANLLSELIPVPYFTATSETFTSSISTEIKSIPLSGIEIKFTTDGSEPTLQSNTYSSPLTFTETTTLKAKSFRNGLENGKLAVNTTFYKMDDNMKIELKSTFANQYAAGGKSALIDGIKGSEDFRSGAWQGFEGQDIIGIISFAVPKKVSSVQFSCLQDIKSWIFMPIELEIELSFDGVNFGKAITLNPNFPNDQQGTFIKNYSLAIEQDQVKAIRFRAKTIGTCPKGHLGEGEKSWLFMDEIEVK